MTDQPKNLLGTIDKKEWLNTAVESAIDSGLKISIPPITGYVRDRVPSILIQEFLYSGVRTAVSNRLKVMYDYSIVDTEGDVVRKTRKQMTLPNMRQYVREQIERQIADETALVNDVTSWLKVNTEIELTAKQFIAEVRKELRAA